VGDGGINVGAFALERGVDAVEGVARAVVDVGERDVDVFGAVVAGGVDVVAAAIVVVVLVDVTCVVAIGPAEAGVGAGRTRT